MIQGMFWILMLLRILRRTINSYLFLYLTSSCCIVSTVQICVSNMDVLLLLITSSAHNPLCQVFCSWSVWTFIRLSDFTQWDPFYVKYVKYKVDATELSHVAGERMMVTLTEFVFPFLSSLGNKVATIQNCVFGNYYRNVITADTRKVL